MNQIKHENLPNIPIISAQVDTSAAIKLSSGAKMILERSLMARADIWHKVRVIKGGHYSKEIVLKAILKTVDPADLIPVKYQVCGEDAFFIARNCGPALEKLCMASLIIKNINGDALILMITLGFASIRDLKVNIQPLLLTALTKRYNPNEKTLNLENFHTDPDVSKTVYCPLSQVRTSNHVLKLAKTAIATFEYLNLQHNDLFNISAIENSNLTAIKYLDLRHNNLLNMCVLTPLKNLTVIKLWLDGNPLCENYSTVRQYVDSAKKYCPHLQELDGVCISSKMPFMYKDHFRDDKVQHLVHKFTTHFFNLYDQVDRSLLKGLYHKNAVYSMSFSVPNTIAGKTNLQQYTALSRNLLRKTRKKITTFYEGEEQILEGHAKLPRSYHDRSSFKYDVLYDDGKCLVICVSGLLKKLSLGLNVLSFNRTFILSVTDDNEYHILNDQYHLDAAPENITHDKITAKTTFDETSVCFSPSEKSVLIVRFGQITTLNKEWCEMYLSEAKWDMRQALSNFMKDYKSLSVPENAFYK
ncbi:nuclear RNA export factor 2 [Harpegnathos saltator]|uniref:Nuclear RNA export factor 1 n=1 Tax=Harpegnathos saltator TaxID=610380 RepID=E2BWH2_HARSA|nr:nuclear RNA export factor 2 [Harpegnathos saltator]EFN79928.1 Nuclear RNA export factor 1 [Harpegnathos saltator]